MQRYRRMSEEQRCQLFILMQMRISVSEISLRPGLHRSTIYRELKRNSVPSKGYEAKRAHKLACVRRRSCAPKRIYKQPENWDLLKRALEKKISPDIIAGRFKLSSHQTIYNEIKKYRPSWRIHLFRYNRRSGRKRGNRSLKAKKPDWHRSISERPALVDERSRLGDWERDSVLVKDREMILVCLERKSRFVRLKKIDKSCFKNVPEDSVELMTVGELKPQTLTNDNGPEFHDSSKINLPVYYCDPYSPHQRGSVENVIRLLRRDITRKTSITDLTPERLNEIADKLNHRPRKILNYKTPYEIIHGTSVALSI